MTMPNSRIVYSTETGRICPKCQSPISACRCKKKRPEPKSQIKPDSIIRIRREVKGRKGKTVTTITGLDLDDNALNFVSKQLKQWCRNGGSVKDGMVIIRMKGMLSVLRRLVSNRPGHHQKEPCRDHPCDH
jgi:translation initiation factor 1